MKKINKKVAFGIGAGLLAAVVGVGCLLGKKKNNDDYIEGGDCYEDELIEVDEDVESEE